MRRGLIHIACVFAALVCLEGCYKDLSKEATITLPDMFISGPENDISIYFGEELVVSPTVAMVGRTPDEFTYLWQITKTSGELETGLIDLGEELVLRFPMVLSPSDLPYTLILSVTDPETGLTGIKSWKVLVKNAYEEGLVVAHTSDGGKTSDLDHFMAAPVTFGYTESKPHYSRNVYSFANGEKIQGRVNSMFVRVASSGAAYNEERLIIGTDAHMLSLSTLSFEKEAEDQPLFTLPPGDGIYSTSMCSSVGGYGAMAIVNGVCYVCICNGDNHWAKAGYNFSPNGLFTPENTGCSRQHSGGKIGFFKPDTGQFLYILAWNISQTSFQESDLKVSFNSVGAECLAAGALDKTSPIAFLIKDVDGKYHICCIDETAIDPFAVDVDPPEIENAKYFAFCDNAPLMYYATDSNIYVVLISGGKAYYKDITWSPDSKDEKITHIEQYKQGWYGTQQLDQAGYARLGQYHRRQLIITTYNASTGEGKIYLRPFNVSTGLFTREDNGVYGGFGEITAIAATK